MRSASRRWLLVGTVPLSTTESAVASTLMLRLDRAGSPRSFFPICDRTSSEVSGRPEFSAASAFCGSPAEVLLCDGSAGVLEFCPASGLGGGAGASGGCAA